jgi:hypothetical protein
MADSTVVVEEKSDFASKINWTNAVSAVAVLAALFGLDIPPDMQVKIVGFLGVATPVVTMILRTFFTKKLTASSAARL